MTLQKLCLATIVNSFDRFYHVYSSTDNDDLRRKFLFLQKFYASELMPHLYCMYQLKEEYADLLFTTHLKRVQTAWFSNFSWEKVLQIFAKIGPSLEKVIFNDNSIVTQWKTIICYLPNVKVITYVEACNNDVLKCIAKFCPKLETLDVKNSFVTSDGLKHFYQKEQGKVPCPLLKEIYMKSIRVKEECIKHLVINLPLLEDVEYYSVLPDILYDLHKIDLGSLDKVQKYNLLCLDLLKHYTDKTHTQRYDEILKVCVTVCPKITAFYYPISKLEHLNACSLLFNVTGLCLYCVNSTPIDVNNILKEKSKKLTSLTLRNCSVSFSVLAECVHLNFLKLKQVKIQYNEKDFIPKFYDLKTFFIKHLDLSEPDYFEVVSLILSCSPNLNDLCLKNFNFFTLEMKSEILKCCEQCAIKFIDIGGNSVETDFLKDILSACPTLETLDLDPFSMDVNLEELCRFARNLPNRPKISVSVVLSDSD